MLHTIPTYTYRTEAVYMASEPLLCAIEGQRKRFSFSDYSELYSLLRVLSVSVGINYDKNGPEGKKTHVQNRKNRKVVNNLTFR